MYPRDDGKTTSKYPDDRLFPLRDMITEERIPEPDMLDHDNEARLLVIKNDNLLTSPSDARQESSRSFATTTLVTSR